MGIVLRGVGQWTRPASMWAGLAAAMFFPSSFLPGSAAHAGQFAWTSNGPYYGSANVLAVDPHCSEQIWGGGMFLYRSTDAGAAWQRMETGTSRFNNARAVALDPQTAGVVYVGSGGVHKSTDGGLTWGQMNNGLTNTDVQTLAIAPGSPLTLLAGTSGGAFRTTNGGELWTPAPGLEDTAVRALAVFPQSSQIALAGLWTGMYRTTDGGSSWSGPLSSLPASAVSGIRISPLPPYNAFAVLNGSVLYRSTDDGATWVSSGDLAGYVWVEAALAAHPTDPDGLFVGTSDGLFRTTDGGSSWTDLSAGLPDQSLDAVAVDPAAPQTIFAGTGESWAIKSTDGGVTWADASGMVKDDAIQAVVVDATAPSRVYAVGVDGGFVHSTDAGETWARAADDGGTVVTNGQQLAVDPTNPNVMYLAALAGIWKTTDAGIAWTNITQNDIGWQLFLSVELDPGAPAKIFAGTDANGLYRSTDGGETWTDTASGPLNENINDIALDPASSQVLYLGAPSGVWRSTDGGDTFAPKSNGFFDTVLSLAVHPNAPSTLFAGGWSGLYRSTDGAESWAAVNPEGEPFWIISDLEFDPRDPAILYAALNNVEGGVWSTSDGGNTWAPIGASMEDREVGDIAVSNETPPTLFAASSGGKGGVAQYTRSEPTPTPTPNPSWTPTPTPNVVTDGKCLIGPPDSATGTCPCFVDLDGDRRPSSGEPPVYFRWKDKAAHVIELVNPWQQCAPEGNNEIRLIDSSAVTPCDAGSRAGKLDTMLLASHGRRINITGWDAGGGFTELSGHLDQTTARSAAARITGLDSDGDSFLDSLHFEQSGSSAFDLTMFGTDLDEDGTIDYLAIPGALLLQAPACARVAAGTDVYCPVGTGGTGGVQLVFDMDGDGEADEEAPSSASTKPADFSEVPVAAGWLLLAVLGAGLAGVIRGLRRFLGPLAR